MKIDFKKLSFVFSLLCSSTLQAMRNPEEILSDVDKLHMTIKKTENTETRKQIVRDRVLPLLGELEESIGIPNRPKNMAPIKVAHILKSSAEYNASAYNLLGDYTKFYYWKNAAALRDWWYEEQKDKSFLPSQREDTQEKHIKKYKETRLYSFKLFEENPYWWE